MFLKTESETLYAGYYIYFRISQITEYLFPKCPNWLFDIRK